MVAMQRAFPLSTSYGLGKVILVDATKYEADGLLKGSTTFWKSR